MLTQSLATRGALVFANLPQDQKHDAKLAVRKWCTANGVPSTYSRNLGFADLERVYNDQTDAALRSMIAHATNSTPSATVTIETEEPATMNAHANSANPLAPLLAYLQEQIGQSVNETRVRQIVADALADAPAKKIDVTYNGNTVQLNERTNPVFARVLKKAAKGRNVLLVGPAGCGKTTLAKQVAKALNRRFGMISGSAGASESQLMGWLLPVDGGKFEYRASEFVNGYEAGNFTYLMDEYDGFDGNMQLCANSALANGHFNVPQRLGNECVTRGDNVNIICTANTFGTGADPIYSGRNQMDGASLDRFDVIEMDYDRELERDMAKAGNVTESQLQRFWKMREDVANAGLLRIVGTRSLDKVIANIDEGMSFDQALADLTVGWSADEKQRAGF